MKTRELHSFTLSHLPNDLLDIIFKYLDLKNIINISAASIIFYQISNKIWQENGKSIAKEILNAAEYNDKKKFEENITKANNFSGGHQSASSPYDFFHFANLTNRSNQFQQRLLYVQKLNKKELIVGHGQR